MKRVLMTLMVLAVACFLPGNGLAEVLTHESGKVEITVPEKWVQKREGAFLTITSPDGGLAVVFMMLEAAAVDKAFEAVGKELDKILGAVTWENDGKPAEEKINEMPTWEWNGKTKDGKVVVGVLSIDTPADKNLGIYWFTDVENEKKYEEDVKTIVRGLKPMHAAAPTAEPAAAPADAGE